MIKDDRWYVECRCGCKFDLHLHNECPQCGMSYVNRKSNLVNKVVNEICEESNKMIDKMMDGDE